MRCFSPQSLEAPRRVYHYWYTAWPDHGVPDSPRQLLRLTEEVRRARERDDVRGRPVVVHCRSVRNAQRTDATFPTKDMTTPASINTGLAHRRGGVSGKTERNLTR